MFSSSNNVLVHNRWLFTWIAIVVLQILQAHGIVNYVKNYCHLKAQELQLSISGRSLPLLQNVVFVVAMLVLLERLPMVNGFMLSVQR